MIQRKDVIILLVPHPSSKSVLATKPHMYICRDSKHPEYVFLKCQTTKPFLKAKQIIKHSVEELPDIRRNPFNVQTTIDCDKLFQTYNSVFSDALKTPSVQMFVMMFSSEQKKNY